MQQSKRKGFNKRVTKALMLDWLVHVFPWRFVIVFTFLTGIIAAYYSDPKIPGPELTGMAIGLHGPQGENPGPSQLIVILDSGQEVIVGGSGSVVLKRGHRVTVRLYTSEFLGFKRYKFISYLDE